MVDRAGNKPPTKEEPNIMAFRDLREWIGALEKERMLSRVQAEVDWDEEIGAITREVCSRGGPALLFENIKDHRASFCHRLFTNGLGSADRVCRLLGLPRGTHNRDIARHLKEAFKKSMTPKTVSKAPVKQNMVKGDDVDLTKLPVPKWNPLDGGRYIMTSSSVVTRDPESQELNVGTYRGMVSTKRTISVLLAMSQDWGKHFSKWRGMGKSMPVAVILGWDPTLFVVSSTPLASPEYGVAGVLRGEPVDLVRCETSDLLVPATAEIVIEGRISPDPKTFEPEGPYAEYPGYYGGFKTPKHTIQVECVTYRDDPIFMGCITGASPGRRNEGSFFTRPAFSAVAWATLDQAGVPNVLDVWRGLWPENMRVRIRKIYRGHARQVANALWGASVANYAAKHLIVVDEDIDIHDDEAMEWALAYRVNAAMGDITMFPGTVGSMLDPSVPLKDRNSIKYGQGKWTRVLIDATINWELEPQEQFGGNRFPPLGTEISPRMKELLKKRWSEYGL
jgi:4-hydroxy-3-polyprenylbenzoate decarboxylase